MTVTGILEYVVEIPEGVKVERSGQRITVSGPNGKLARRLHHPRVEIEVAGNGVRVSSEFPRTKERALVGTFTAHIRNMIYGAQRDFEAKMKIVYSHFPMKVNVKGDKFVIENFMGERGPRTADILENVKVSVKGSDVVITGPDNEAVGQTAANIERATRIRGFDPRVFQDGIYIVNRGRRVEA